MTHTLTLQHRHKTFQVQLDNEGTLELCMDGVVRKRRPASGREPQYVWTNVELEWEEHHYIEARYWARDDKLTVTINGDVCFDGGLLSECLHGDSRQV